MPRSTLDRLRADLPSGEAVPDVRAHRGVPLDLPGPGRGRRRPDSIGKAIPNAEILVVRDGRHRMRSRRGGRARSSRRPGRARLLERSRAHRRALRPPPGRTMRVRAPENAVFSGDLVKRDDEGFLYFVGRKDEMIKTSGYRVSPTEIEEVAHSTGLVGDAVALGVDDAAPRTAHRARREPSERAARPRGAARGTAPRASPLHGAAARRDPTVTPPVTQQQARPQAAARGVDRSGDATRPGASRAHGGRPDVGGIPLERLAERVGSTPFFAYDRALLTERVDVAAGDAAGSSSSSATRSRRIRCPQWSSTWPGSSTRSTSPRQGR